MRARSRSDRDGLTAKMATTKSPVEFIRQVRQEVAKVTWPTRKETTMTTIMVFVMVVITSLFFLLVDSVLSTAVTKLLGFGGGQ
jgi:preprotein translocase subunit SecE